MSIYYVSGGFTKRGIIVSARSASLYNGGLEAQWRNYVCDARRQEIERRPREGLPFPTFSSLPFPALPSCALSSFPSPSPLPPLPLSSKSP